MTTVILAIFVAILGIFGIGIAIFLVRPMFSGKGDQI